jgi:uncharacterized protein YraI
MNFRHIIISGLFLTLIIGPVVVQAKTVAVSAVKAKSAVLYNGTVNADGLGVRSGPGTNYAKLKTLSRGEKISVLQEKNGWSRIASGQQWVSSKYISKSIAKLATKKVVVPKKDIVSIASVPVKTEDVAVPVKSVAISTASVLTDLTATCMKAIKKANAYCLSIAKGCSSMSKTPKCLEANDKCEVQQQEALAICPTR